MESRLGNLDTYSTLATRRLDRIWTAVHGAPPPPEARARMLRMLAPWGDRRIPERSPWPSDIGDDHSPFEFSLALESKTPELRFLVEAQGEEPTFRSTRDAAVALTRALEREDGADLARFERVKDLLLPDVDGARFSLWHAGRLSSSPQYKAYFNPQIQGVERSWALVDEAMERLGVSSAWRAALPIARQRSSDEIRYFALDLARDERARVKVYLYQRGIDGEGLERMAAGLPRYRRGDATEFCRAITGSVGPYTRIPLCTYLSFVGGEPIPQEMTIQIPIRFYAADDAAARDRVKAYLQGRGASAAVYERAVTAASERDLAAGSGIQSYVSLRLDGASEPRLVVYLAVEAFAVAPRHDPESMMWALSTVSTGQTIGLAPET